MDEEYDVIICGTGMKECILSGLFSVEGKKVLHLDRNNYYGGECASLNLTNLWEKFKPGEKPPQSLGANRDWNVDLIPKFVMANGTLVKLLLHTGVTKYLEWKSAEGTFFYQYQEGGWISSEKNIHKVPASPQEVLTSSLMGMIEKTRATSFFQFVLAWNEDKPDTLQGLDPRRSRMKDCYKKFGLEQGTIDFLGHGVALEKDDDYLNAPCGIAIAKMKLYIESIARYGNSPFIYPVYGLGGLPEGFSRLSAIHGGTYMLNKDIDGFEFDADGKVCGVRSGDEVARTKMVICDPSYVKDKNCATAKVSQTGQVIRAICLLSGPIPETDNCNSCQIILTAKELKRKNDVYVMMVSHAHQICKEGYYVAMVSTQVETNTPQKEIEKALKLLGKIEHIFCTVSSLFTPSDDGKLDNIYVTSSYDALSHFETAADDVLKMWEKMHNQKLELKVHPSCQQ